MSTYSVKRGDTLSHIASTHHTTVAALMKANPKIHNANVISVGEHLTLPGKKDDYVAPKKAAPKKAAPKASTYVVKHGDTLGHIATTHHTTVSALMHANPKIHNANVISVGEHLSIPGAKSSSTTKAKAKPKASGGGSSAAYNAAHSVLGHNIQQLKYSGPLAKYLAKWPSSHVCCANFVSACLQKAGQISKSQHNDSVRGLASNLSRDPQFSKVSLKNAKVGDVVCFRVPGEGDYAHVEMFAGWKNGQAQFIGSNNVNSDGSQRISQGHAGYHIDVIYHYHG